MRRLSLIDRLAHHDVSGCNRSGLRGETLARTTARPRIASMLLSMLESGNGCGGALLHLGAAKTLGYGVETRLDFTRCETVLEWPGPSIKLAQTGK